MHKKGSISGALKKNELKKITDN
ncbi:Protein of unknown function [Bacillus toyonensis]|nr:Protein of unknown function [Bacillus toyonensis]